MSRVDRFKSQRSIQLSNDHKRRFVDGGKICTKCKKVRKLDEYYNRENGKQSCCKICSSEINKKRHNKLKQPLW